MVAAQSGHTECTFGKLFVTDNTTSSVHVIDISSGQRSNLVPEHSITVKGAPGMNLNYAHKGAVAALYRGNVDIGYTDGSVTFIDSGVRTEDHGDHGMVEYANPSVIDNASFDCARAIHFVRHDDKIAIFCDGSYDAPQVNSTVWVVDENKFGSSTESAIVFEETLQGSHHGVAIPVDDDHVLYSLASSDRVERTDAGASDTLPHTFQITDYEGNILHSIADTSSPDTSCSGFRKFSSIGSLSLSLVFGSIFLRISTPIILL